MSANLTPNDELNDIQPTLGLDAVVLIMLAAVIGAFAAVVVLPAWLPGLSETLLGAEPKAYWYLSRTSGVIGIDVSLLLATIESLPLLHRHISDFSGRPRRLIVGAQLSGSLPSGRASTQTK